MQSLINPNNTVKLLKTQICNANCFPWLCIVSISGWIGGKHDELIWQGNKYVLGYNVGTILTNIHFSICAATMQFQGCAGSPVTLQFYSIGSVPEHISPLILQLIWRWLWRWPLWRSAVWSQAQSKCPWMKYRSSNCSPRQLLPTQFFCVFICPKEQEALQIMRF